MRYCSIHRLDYVAQCDACVASRDRKKRDEDKTVDDDPIQLKKMLALRKRLDPDAPDIIAFRDQDLGDFEKSTTAKYPQKALADLLDAGEISREQYERLRLESATEAEDE